MLIFGGGKRPKLDGLTREEEKRRNALNSEVTRRASLTGALPAAASVLRDRAAEEPEDALWPLLLGSQLMHMHRFGQALDAFNTAIVLDGTEVRAHYGAAMACYRAADYKQEHGEASSDEVAPAGLTVDNLYHEALRHFQDAMELTPDKVERDELASAAATVRRAVARKAGRL
jgi:tetratricopeptide (TPR) repeat protein